MNRAAAVTRNTMETRITMTLNLDGKGHSTVNTGIGFMDHMLASFARHGFFDLEVHCEGDLDVDAHHTVEDLGIVLGMCLDQALGDRSGIARFGQGIVPMDEALCMAAIDISGRPYLGYDCEFTVPAIGGLSTELVREFYYALSYKCAMSLHIKMLSPGNNHHMAEAMFKAFAKALEQATRQDPRAEGVLSTKGRLG